ncbi:SMP-30/gluconolactonase/LRE family protein [Pseudoxanthomonas wuyuanensis]|uniref:SMP-30/gluconolactonase/LRE family protein n=1 Tax=Pseudoxanthomonas wuyuanensis TaxID=1073196 RepID=UPI001EE44A6D|nr:SMP-30/gluconolactonase/LRE family protein [Pseudoxanthomonas wuyuanensis]
MSRLDESGSALATLAIDSRCVLAECVLWCERRQTLFWTDIDAAQLWMHTPGSGVTRQWSLPEKLGSLALCDDGRLLLALAKRLALADVDGATDSLPLQYLADIEPDLAHTRSNDGRCDRDGNFVFGTKSERSDRAPAGSFYQFSTRHGLRRLPLPHAVIPNSICFSIDGRTMYYCDSVQPAIFRCNYDAAGAGVSDARVLVALEHPDGSPDGSIIDAEGCLWNAQWGAGQVVRYRPDGSTDRVVAVPVKNPSCCAIGGDAMDRLYISSARAELEADELAAMPASGGIFQWPLGRALGLPESRFLTA